jgi:uncharacterized membrane protein YkoI
MNFIAYVLMALLALPALAEKRIAMKDLPPAVRTAVDKNTVGSEVKGIRREVEKGKTMFEVETVANGKTRDFVFDANGGIVSVEQEVTIDAIPAGARAAFEKKAAGSRISKVETITKGQAVVYEAEIVAKSGKKSEFTVNADGVRQK